MDRVKARNAKSLFAILAGMILFAFFAQFTGYQAYHRWDEIFCEHASQYFSIIVTSSPTSKRASIVAKLPHVEQYFCFLLFGLDTNGLSAVSDLTTWVHVLQKQEIVGVNAIIFPTTKVIFISCLSSIAESPIS
jgi:hypothetical protein